MTVEIKIIGWEIIEKIKKGGLAPPFSMGLPFFKSVIAASSDEAIYLNLLKGQYKLDIKPKG
jgi:hypothetical protein